MAVQIQITLCSEHAKPPMKAYPSDVGFDLYADTDCVIEPHQSVLVSTGIKLQLPSNIEAQVRPRSGLALKHQITVLNTPGTIDPGYQGQVGVILINHGHQMFQVTKGMRIAQLVFQPIVQVELVDLGIESIVEHSLRGECGFGSSGTQ